MALPLSDRARAIGESATFAVAAKARALKAKGVDVCDLGVGELDTPVPEAMQEAAHRAIRDGKNRYPPAAGIPELRAAIAEKLRRENGLSYAPEEIFVATGAKHAIYCLAQVLLGPGDEVVVPAPYFVSYPEIVKAAGATPVVVDAPESDGFLLTPERLRRALTPRTKLVFLNTPANPTGAVYPAAAQRALAGALADHPTGILTDEIYERLVYDGAAHASLPALAPGLRERTVVVNGFSKSFAVTGWRLGYAAGPRHVVDAAVKLVSQSTSGAASIVQWAALEALRLPPSAFDPVLREYAARRRMTVEALRAIPGVSCAVPEGAFYVFPNVSRLYGRTLGGVAVRDSVTFCEALLAEAHVAAVPGGAFGADAHVRLSYAVSRETLDKALARMREFCGKLAGAPVAAR